MTSQEIKDGYLEIIRAELSYYGVDPTQVKLSKHGEIEIEDHIVDQSVFHPKAQWTELTINIRCYTTDDNRIIFMPEQIFYDEYRNREDLEKILDDQIDEVAKKILEITGHYTTALAEANENKTLAERFSPQLLANYQKTDSLADIKSWRVNVILRNSAGVDSPKIGEFDEVGYTWIGLESGYIVPIARADEHHRGGDLMHDLISQGLIPEDRYYPIFSGQDYASANDMVALQAFKTWRKLGGPNIIIRSESRGLDNHPFQITMDDFIKAEANIEINKGKLAPLGQILVDNLKSLSTLCIPARQDERKEKQLYKQALKTYNQYLKQIRGFTTDAEQGILKSIMVAESTGGEEGIKQIEQLFFGFESFKNQLHNKIRKALKPGVPQYDQKDMIAIFGDLDLANHEFGSL